MKHIPLILLLASCLLPAGASAQWQWLDKDGRTVFSDRAPPATVPEKDIRKRPGQARAPTNGNTSPSDASVAPLASDSASAQATARAPKPSVLDKELAEKKKKAEQVDAEKRQAEEARQAQIRADNCVRARSARAGLDSGIRMSRFNAKGEREVLDDATRASETNRVQSIIESDCK